MDFVILAPIAGVAALIFAYLLTNRINRVAPGTDRMKEIASHIHEGSLVFLTREYKTLSIFVAVLFVILWIGIDKETAISFLVGSGFSAIAGFVGMQVATRANVEQLMQPRRQIESTVAFSGGAVMGLTVVGLGIFGVGALYMIFSRSVGGTEATKIITGFSLGASSIALFARVGGGIYTKAADVGADLVGKVEAGIPEDDPRNPAVIADNVGDNVGDVAGIGADLLNPVGSMFSCYPWIILKIKRGILWF